MKPVQQVPNHAPNKLNFNQFNAPSYPNESQSSIFQMSKDGIENLKSKFYESASKSSAPAYNPIAFYNSNNENTNNFSNNFSYTENKPQHGISHVSKVKLNKLTSHENYLFNSKNNPNFSNQSQSNSNYDEFSSRSNFDDSIATSDL